ncbi:ribonuclease D [Chloroflexota bacterium]
MDLPIEIVSRLKQLNNAVQELGTSRSIAIDTEANSRHRYPEQLCLIQLATPDKIFLVDTIYIRETTPLNNLFLDSSIIKVFHTADYDIRSLARHLRFQVHGVFDIAIAARFIGITKFALSTLVEDWLGLTIEKNTKIQKADWGKRPLSAEALEYAANDVRYLLELRNIMETKLGELGRLEWVIEECARLEELRYEPTDPETAYLSVKGASKLDGKSLAMLKVLFKFREQEASHQNRPPYYIMPDSTLVHLAENPKADLVKTPGLGQTGLRRFGNSLQRAIKEGLAAPPQFTGEKMKKSVKKTENILISSTINETSV